MNNEELKPCPFCGSEVKLVVQFGDEFMVLCPNCEAQTNFHDKEGAIAAWNKRANSEKPNLSCLEKANNSICRQREQEIRIGVIFRLARYIQRNVKLYIGCDLHRRNGVISTSLCVGDRYFVKSALISCLEQMMYAGEEIPALTFSGKEFLKAFMDKSKEGNWK